MARGSARDPGKLSLRWEMYFWHPTELSDDGEPVERARKLHSGFENIRGNGQSVSVVIRDGATEVFSADTTRHVVSLDPLPEGRLTVTLTPSANLLSGQRAGPHLDVKGSGSKDDVFSHLFEIMFRTVSFEIAVDADGVVTAPTPDRLLPVRDPAPPPVAGLPQRPAPGPHAYVFVETVRKRSGAVRTQQIHVDWKPDWIARHAPRLRPTPVGRGGNDVREIILHITTGPNIAGAVQKFMLPRKEGRRKPPTSGIHYIVDMDGHVVKMLHERHGAFHAGFAPPNRATGRTIPHLAAWGGGETRAQVAKTSIGIEHVAAPGDEWPEEQIVASLDLVRQLANHFGVEPRHVVGHNDVIVLKATRALPKTTKPCPAGGLPWERYQDAGLSLAADAKFEPPANLYGGVFTTGSVLDGSAPSEAIEELQRDLQRIGWWLPKKSGGRRPLGTFDDATRAGVKRFQARFMTRQGLTFAEGKVDLATAQTIKRVVAALPA